MTRDEFLRDINTWDELIAWCREENCDNLEGVYDSDSYSEWVDDHTEEWARTNTWTDLWNMLDDLPTGYDYYYRDDYEEWRGLDDGDFSDYRDDVLGWGDDNEVWDAEEEEEAEETVVEDEPDPEDETPTETEDISVIDLFSSCCGTIQQIKADADEAELKAEAEEAEAFSEFLNNISITTNEEA